MAPLDKTEEKMVHGRMEGHTYGQSDEVTSRAAHHHD